MRTGEVVQLGRHRLMCGDAGNPEHVARLFAGASPPDLVFTSPPYAQQRTYVSGIGDWNVLMQRVFGALPAHEKTQVLVNLGLVHRKGEWVPYWDGWIEWMRTQGWRRFGWYVWDKLYGMVGDHQGRLAPAHEWIFHFNKQSRKAVKCIPTKNAGMKKYKGCIGARGWQQNSEPRVTQAFKIPDSVVRTFPVRNGDDRRHPAVFPVALPTEIIRAYTDPGDVVFDPFGGSGTTMLAAEKEGRTAYLMECEPSYCAIAVERFAKHCAQPPLPGAA